MEVESIKRHFKSRLVGTVLNGYLCLRKLVVQRTKLIDETQDMLLEMLEDMTTGGWVGGSCRAWWIMEGLSSNPAWKEGFLFPLLFRELGVRGVLLTRCEALTGC